MFRFELQPILDHREHLEQEEQRRVARVQQHLIRLEDDIAAVETMAEDSAALWERELGGDIAPPRQEIFAAWRMELRRRRSELLTQHAQARRSLTQARGRLLAAHRERRKFDLLRERALDEHRAREAAAERKFTEDLTVMRHRFQGGWQ